MTEPSLIGTTLGRFEILAELGRGGMAVVYRARQTDLDRVVALKVLPPALTYDTSYVARFRQEARSAARLEHPHIMPIYEVGEAGGLHYIAMKYIAGKTVKDLVQDDGALTVQQAAIILAQVGEALDYAHKHGVIHRDIKPSNMMVTPEGWVFLTDFGLARGTGSSTAGLTMAGTVMGTPEYMSPEQAQGLPEVGPATDIYALGVVLYELLTGTFPFRADTPMAMLAARLLQAPTPPRDVRGDLPTPVEDVIMRALARKPEARFPSAGAMVAALRSAAGIGSAEPPRPQTPVAGTPAIGATIKVPPPPPTPGSGSPYVQQIPPAHTPPPLSYPQTAPPQVAIPGAYPQQAAAAPRKGPRNLAVILGALGVAALACIGLFAAFAIMGRRAPGPTDTPTAVVDTTLGPLLATADEALAETDGLATAVGTYRQLLIGHPDDPRVLARLAVAYNAGGDWANAEDLANQLIDAPASDGTQVALGYALLADAYASQGDMLSALGEIGKAIENDPELSLGHAIESNLLANRAVAIGSTAEMDAALASLDRAVDTLDDDEPLVQALTHHAMGYTYSQEHALSGSEEYFSQSEEQYAAAITQLPAAGLFRSNLAGLYLSAEDYAQARDRYQEAVASGYLPAHAGRGWTLYYEGATADAEAAFDEAIAQAPEDPDGYFGKGRLRYDEQNYDAAIEQLTLAVERNPRSPVLQGWLGEALFWKGFNSEGEPADTAFTQAVEAYRAALARDDRYVFAVSGLAWTFQHLEDYAESVRMFDRAIELDQHNAAHYNGKGWSLFNQGSLEEAAAAFRAALERDPAYADAHYNLGRVFEEQGQIGEAREAYQRALELDPENAETQERLAELDD